MNDINYDDVYDYRGNPFANIEEELRERNSGIEPPRCLNPDCQVLLPIKFSRKTGVQQVQYTCSGQCRKIYRKIMFAMQKARRKKHAASTE